MNWGKVLRITSGLVCMILMGISAFVAGRLTGFNEGYVHAASRLDNYTFISGGNVYHSLYDYYASVFLTISVVMIFALIETNKNKLLLQVFEAIAIFIAGYMLLRAHYILDSVRSSGQKYFPGSHEMATLEIVAVTFTVALFAMSISRILITCFVSSEAKNSDENFGRELL